MFVGSRRDVRQVLPVRRVFVVGVVALLCGVVGCTPGAQSAGSSAGGTVATVTQAEDPDGLAGSGIEGVLGSFQDGDVVYFYVLDELGVKNGLILPHDFVASADGRSMMQGGSVVANVGRAISSLVGGRLVRWRRCGTRSRMISNRGWWVLQNQRWWTSLWGEGG